MASQAVLQLANPQARWVEAQRYATRRRKGRGLRARLAALLARAR